MFCYRRGAWRTFFHTQNITSNPPYVNLDVGYAITLFGIFADRRPAKNKRAVPQTLTMPRVPLQSDCKQALEKGGKWGSRREVMGWLTVEKVQWARAGSFFQTSALPLSYLAMKF